MTIEGVDPVDLYGEKNSRLNLVKNAFPELKIVSRGNNLKIVGQGKDAQRAKATIEIMVRLLKERHELNNQTVADILNGNNPFDTRISKSVSGNTITYGRNGRPIKAKTKNQSIAIALGTRKMCAQYIFRGSKPKGQRPEKEKTH